jgi:hypothetical protein
MDDLITTVFEILAVVLLAAGAALAVAAAIGGLLGAGLGLTMAAMVLGSASAVLRLLARPGLQSTARHPR